MGGIKFAWLAVWVLSPDWLRWSCHPWGRGVRAVPRLCILYPGFALQLRKITENLSQGSRKALGSSAPNVICLVNLAIVGDGLDWPAGPCRPWLSCQTTGSTLGQHKYLPSCRTREFSTSTNFESKLAVREWISVFYVDFCWPACSAIG